ncbi:MAG TPA: WD40 repeat domain-containing protein, partial [Terrimicrobiaceae bacterium]|nr:WD40 repeat domain-containing protein [Terrimicrobiaceae bacterium]
VTLFDSATGAFEHSLSHRGLAVDADYSDDGRLLATCSMVMKTSGYAQVWDAETGVAITQPLTAEDELHNIGISPDGGLICATERSGHVRIWSVATSRECVDPLPHDTSAFPAWFSSDGKRLLTVSGGKAQFHELWDLGGPAPSWLPDLGEAVGGFVLNDNGVVVSLEDRVQILNQIRKTATTGSGDDRHIKWARWFFEDRRTRQRSPFPQTTPVEALSDKAMDATGDGLARLPATKATDAPAIHK